VEAGSWIGFGGLWSEAAHVHILTPKWTWIL